MLGVHVWRWVHMYTCTSQATPLGHTLKGIGSQPLPGYMFLDTEIPLQMSFSHTRVSSAFLAYVRLFTV